MNNLHLRNYISIIINVENITFELYRVKIWIKQYGLFFSIFKINDLNEKPVYHMICESG